MKIEIGEVGGHAAATGGRSAHIVVVGNEKGGSGKTTTAMHVAVALLRLGRRVAVIDVDVRQRSLLRYIENRVSFAEKTGHTLSYPWPFVVERANDAPADVAGLEEARRFERALSQARESADFVVIDTPGSDTPLSRLAHASAETLLTPMNDSFVDFDLLASLDPVSFAVQRPSVYAEFVWDCRKKRMLDKLPNLDWVVMRNRVSSIEARNKRRIERALRELSRRIGFRVARGFAERVIFRELFPMGLTLFDLPLKGINIPFSMSHVAARQEVRELLLTLKLPGLEKISAKV